MRILLLFALLAAGCRPSAPPEPAVPEANAVALYARLPDPQSPADAEAQYRAALEDALAGHIRSIRFEAFTDADGRFESVGIDLLIEAAQGDAATFQQTIADTLRIHGAPYATQVYVVMAEP